MTRNAPTLEDFCNAANDLYAAPTEDRFYAVVNLAREALANSSRQWDEGYRFALSQFEAEPYAWMALGALTARPVFSTTPPDDPNVAGWEPLYRREPSGLAAVGLGASIPCGRPDKGMCNGGAECWCKHGRPRDANG